METNTTKPGPPVSGITQWGLELLSGSSFESFANKMQEAEKQREEAFSQTRSLNKMVQMAKFAYQRNDTETGDKVSHGVLLV